MGKSSQSARRRSVRRKGSNGGRDGSVLAKLARRFSEFRRTHPRGTRVPMELRSAALAALETGVAPMQLYRACGVSWGQVNAWKEKGAAKEGADVRVFSVVDDPGSGGREVAHSTEQELELRFGFWSVSVRVTDLGSGSEERG